MKKYENITKKSGKSALSCVGNFEGNIDLFRSLCFVVCAETATPISYSFSSCQLPIWAQNILRV